MEKKLKQLQELVDHFQFNLSEYKSSAYDEANTRVDFIDKLFEILDWDISNKQKFSEEWREVVREDKVIIQGKPKAPDYSFRIGGKRMFFVEAKKPSIDIKHDIGPAYQVRRYGYTAKVPLSILTDFEEFAVYDTRIKPNKNDNANVARIFYCTFNEYENHIEFLDNTFSKNAILKGSFKKYILDNKSKKGTSEVDTEFLKLIEQWRNDLARNLAIRNKALTVRQLNYSVQKLIDRILFLRIAEDRQTETYGSLMKLTSHSNVYLKLRTIFDQADAKYNSGLFHSEEFLSNLKIDDKILSAIINGLYYPDSPYEFSVLEVEILGNIYEQFLGKTIRLTASHQAKVEEKPEVRKAGGVYYTPQFIVEYIVSKTVGEMIKVKIPAQISEIKILDPACGSGSFLLGAYSYLLQFHLDYYCHPKKLKSYLKEGKIYQTGENTYYLTIKEKQNILLNNIYGVDIDAQAVEVTKLSLLLKLMEGENQESVGSLFKFSDFTLLPDLSQNIKCGNSLIETDYYTQQPISIFNDEEMRQLNAFDWKNEFSTIYATGGFDVVIGNPPYVRQELLGSIKKYFQHKYKVYHGVADLFVYFIEKGISLLKHSGRFSYIVSNKWLRANYGKPLRQYLIKQHILELLDFGDLPVFTKATTYPSILTVLKNGPIETFKSVKLNTLEFSSIHDYSKENSFEVSTIGLKDSGWALIDKRNSLLLKKIFSLGIPLIEYVNGNIFRGILTGLNEAFIVDMETKERLISADAKCANLIKPFLLGKDIKRYGNLVCNKYLIFIPKGWTKKSSNNVKNKWEWFYENYPSLAAHLEAFEQKAKKRYDKGEYWWELRACEYCTEFEKIKIMVPDISLRGNFTIDQDGGKYCVNTAYIISTDDKYLLGLLNSSLVNYFYRNISSSYRGGYLRFIYQYLAQIPILKINNDDKRYSEKQSEIISLVHQMLDSQKKLADTKLESEGKLFQQKADLIDKQINELVYDLYKLTAEEIEIIENNELF
jgi:type I restriction-modification system DNA methylase subunit